MNVKSYTRFSITSEDRPVQHHFSTWSARLAADFRREFQERLMLLDEALSEADDGTPSALRETALRHVTLVEAGHETAMVALECATVCRESHPVDYRALCAIIKVLIKGHVQLTEAELRRLLEFLAQADPLDPKIMAVDEAIGQVERKAAGQSVPADWRPLLETIRHNVGSSMQKKTKSIDTLMARIDRLSADSIAVRLKADDGWADGMLKELARMSESDRTKWEALLSHASTVAPEPPAQDWDAHPDEIHVDIRDTDAYGRELDRIFLTRTASSAWTQTTSERIRAIGAEAFESLRLELLEAVPDSRPGTLSQFSTNREVMRGLLWTCEHSNAPEVARAVRIAGLNFFRKNSPLGRTAVRMLAHMAASNGLEELTYLLQQVKAETQIRLIESARALVEERTGVGSGDLGDLALPTSGFNEIGKRVEQLSALTAELGVAGDGTVTLRWFKPNGQELKSIPTKVTREHQPEVHNLKTAMKEVKSTLAIGRERLESSPVEQRAWTIDAWRARYFDHPGGFARATAARRSAADRVLSRLSVILSKALLLADDTAITDPTISSQIGGDR
jgi:hypothetical protein